MRLLVLALLALLLVALGSTGAVGTAAAGGERADSQLTEFASCGGLRSYIHRHRRAMREAWKDYWSDLYSLTLFGGSQGVAAPPRMPAPLPPVPATAQPDDPGFSGTNVQEPGVDEPDIVKSDGELIFALAGNKLHVVDARPADPRWLDSLSIPQSFARDRDVRPRELLLYGERVLIIASDWRAGARTLLIEVDASDPSALTVARTWEAEARYVSARLNGTTARVVISSHVGALRGDEPRHTGRVPAARRPGPAWIPDAIVSDRPTGERTRRPLMRCAEVWRPSEFSGLKMLSVVTVDLTNGLPPTDVETVMSGGKIVYGSATGLYVGTERWISPLAQGRAARGSTAIHKFDIATPNETDYAASGRVPGFMLSQWSLSEHDGFLRVASTTDPPWLFRRPARSESFVTVLEQEGDRLRRAGQVGGLGRGERIFAVRFMGDIGYVVTFRQVDPLYTLDLADPSEPFKAGKLKIPGYSAYLHPIGEDRLLGIGQSATRRGTLLGTQISLFDVSDLSNPTRLDRLRFAGGSSLAEFDHHAFLYWEPEQLAVLPIQIRSRRDWSLRYTSARGFRIGDDGGIQKVASIRHGARDMDPVTRTLVVGGRLFTLSERGLKATNLDTFAEEAWIHFKVGRKRR